jgi:hypothetical protein
MTQKNCLDFRHCFYNRVLQINAMKYFLPADIRLLRLPAQKISVKLFGRVNITQLANLLCPSLGTEKKILHYTRLHNLIFSVRKYGFRF